MAIKRLGREYVTPRGISGTESRAGPDKTS